MIYTFGQFATCKEILYCIINVISNDGPIFLEEKTRVNRENNCFNLILCNWLDKIQIHLICNSQKLQGLVDE